MAALSLVGGSWLLSTLNPAEASLTGAGLSWSDDGKQIIHRRLPAHAEAGNSGSEFVYDPVEGETIPSEIRRDGARHRAPSVTMTPVEGEPVHTDSGLRGTEVVAEGGPSSEPSGEEPKGRLDPRMSFRERAKPDRTTQREGRLDYRAIFDPSVVPFKRNHALNQVAADYELSVAKGKITKLEVLGNRVAQGREIFWGSLLLKGSSGSLIPIPSVSADSQILSFRATPAIPLTFHRDAADNYYVRPATPGRFRLVLVMDAGSSYFGRSIPTGFKISDARSHRGPRLPTNVIHSTKRFNDTLGLTKNSDYGEALKTLTHYFRAFEPGDPPEPGRDIFTDLAFGKKGICRHRSFAFVVAAKGLGIPARYVTNEAHIFVEVWVPGPDSGWMRIDLGGGADELVVHNGSDKHRHRPTQPDPFEAWDPTTQGRQSLAGAQRVRGLPRGEPTPAESAGSRGQTLDLRALRALADRQIKRPDIVPGSMDTRTTLRIGSSIVFRGDRFPVSGTVSSDDGSPVLTGLVQVLLLDPETRVAVKHLATTGLNPSGRYSTQVVLPHDHPPGTYDLVGEYMGGQGYAASTSE